jgi:hypothetical protein
MILLIIILFSSSYAFENRDDLLNCFRALLDHNHDDIITAADIDHFLLTENCLPEMYKKYMSGQKIIDTCDTNQDYVLTKADWNTPQSCITKPNQIQYITQLCKACGM